jgi:hypothetical protein
MTSSLVSSADKKAYAVFVLNNTLSMGVVLFAGVATA